MNHHLVSFGVGALVGMAFGLLAGTLLFQRTVVPDVAAQQGLESAHHADPELAPALRELRAELGSLKPPLELIAEVLPRLASLRTQVPADQAAGPGLRREEAASADSELGAARRLAGVGLQGLRLPPKDQKRPPLIKRGDGPQFSRDHRFWTYQQVLDKYGQPDGLGKQPEGTFIWSYSDDASETWMSFTFFEGVVIDASST